MSPHHPLAERYREFVREGLSNRPREQPQGQIDLGSEEFIEKLSAGNQDLKEIPRAQLKPIKPMLNRLFARAGEQEIVQPYREHGSRLREIAAH